MKKVIIADNEISILSMLELALSDVPGIEVTAVESGESLVSKVKENEYSVIFTDNDMEKDNAGIEAIKAMREAGIKTPIYLMSGRYGGNTPETDTPAIAMNAGATGFIPKPYKMSTVTQIVTKHLG
ncbi:MAG: response regulator [Nanoarchaeota archaeon]